MIVTCHIPLAMAGGQGLGAGKAGSAKQATFLPLLPEPAERRQASPR